jgi:hypothetical protein
MEPLTLPEGGAHDARMHAVDRYTGARETPGKLIGEQDIGELRLTRCSAAVPAAGS